mgnify:CR=1 FL=1
MKRIIVLSIITLFAFQTASFAQTEKINLAGRHTIFFESGFKTNSKTTVISNPAGVEAKTGFIGSLSYGYWFDDEWALTFSAGVFGAEATIKYNGVQANAIIPILFGVRYYPDRLALGSVGRFYAGLALGQYLGSASRTKLLFTTETVNESVFGGQASIGVDLFVVSWFKFGPKISYHVIGDFSEIIGTKKNLSGAGFSIDFGFVL